MFFTKPGDYQFLKGTLFHGIIYVIWVLRWQLTHLQKMRPSALRFQVLVEDYLLTFCFAGSKCKLVDFAVRSSSPSKRKREACDQY